MIRDFGFYLVRRPARSVDKLQDFHQQLAQKSVELVFKEFFNGDLLAKEAILIASPSFFSRLQKWLDGQPITETEQLLLTLYKYFVRSSTRCTPFGLFSSCATGTISNTSSIQLPADLAIRKHVTLDAEVLSGLADHLACIPAIRRHLKLFPNTSLYDAGSRLHYIETVAAEDGPTTFISAAEHSEILTFILDRSITGLTILSLLRLLKSTGFRKRESLAYIESLIENQILLFDNRPQLSGPDFLNTLISKLNTIKEVAPITIQLHALRHNLKMRSCVCGIQNGAAAHLKNIGFRTTKPNVLKVDSYFETTQNQISQPVISRIGKQINELLVLDQARLPQALKRFKEEFIRRYEHREMPLATVLDNDLGIGYAGDGQLGSGYAPLLEDLDLFGTEEEQSPSGNAWWQQFVMKKYIHSIRTGENEIRLTRAELEEIGSNKTKHTDIRQAGSFYLFGNILAESAGQLDQGHFQFNLQSCQGPSAVNMFGRFASGMPDLEQQLRRCTQAEIEANPEVIFAEIVHDPDNRAGNILSRPALYAYEIPYLGAASVNEDYQILLSDLMVSVRNNQLVLRSRRLNRRVIPRLSNMHNFRKGLPVYRFLCDVQFQDSNLNVCWDWDIFKKQPHLPRVSYENVIISREKWHINTDDFKKLDRNEIRSKLSDAAVPEQFLVSMGDNEMLIDTRVDLSLLLFADLLRKNDTLTLTEFLAKREQCWLHSGTDRFFSEFVFPFQNPEISPIQGFSVPACGIPRERFWFGSEWLYVKIYTNEKSSEAPLLAVLHELVSQLLGKNVIQLFFFIRYRDPDPHFRLRFKGNPDAHFCEKVMSALQKAMNPLCEAGIVHNIQTDTYEREISRYGYGHVTNCEVLFQIDSLDTLRFLVQDQRDDTERFLFAARKIDQFLFQCDYSISERKALLCVLKEAFFEEFKGDTTLRKKLNNQFQQHKQALCQNLGDGTYEPDPIQVNILKSIAAEPNGKEPGSVPASLIHMTVNRIFPVKQRAYELLLYHCLFKHYDALLARRNMQKAIPEVRELQRIAS